MNKSKSGKTILGVDLGPNSIGWALINKIKKNEYSFIDAGVRVFQAGLNSLEMNGKGKSRNMERREARGRRRLLERHVRRMQKLAIALKANGFLPEGDYGESQIRNRIFDDLDKELDSPYILRSRALNEKLEPFEFGRAVYHLAQRRGFLSNRKSVVRDEKEETGMKAEINDLTSRIKKSGKRTLGNYLASKILKKAKVRDIYTSRKMYEDEFDLIWQFQKKYYPELLTNEYHKKIQHIIFHQRPLKSQKGLVGKCELENGSRRAARSLLVSQRFRYLQAVNNLRVLDNSEPAGRDLTSDERQKLLDTLEYLGDQTFAKIRKLFGLSRFTKFNLEMGGEKKIPGNKTASRLIEVFGLEKWGNFSERRKELIIDDLKSIHKDETLYKRAIKHYKFDKQEADALIKVRLEDGYSNFSQKALKKLMPQLQTGVSLQTAIKKLYPERWDRKIKPLELLPSVDSDEMPDLRNPIVSRTLTELRRVVNAIIKQYGKPEIIRIELARDLKQSSKQRERTCKKMRNNQKGRENAAKKIIEETQIDKPSRDDIIKLILAEECQWECPYSGEKITIKSLLGVYPQFDIEHIIPFDRCLDNSFINKTLCLAKENRSVKRNQTPYEAYSNTKKWDDIIARVKNFKSDVSREKMKRFMLKGKELEDFLNDFTNRQLNDTRWASKWAKQYLGLLYGGVKDNGIDATGKLRVQAVSGPITAYVRNLTGFNAILGDGPGKSRGDHRHHTVDAIVIALTDSNTISLLNKAAEDAHRIGHKRLFTSITPINEEFFDQVKTNMATLVASHRVSNRVRGALHNETFYGKLRIDNDEKSYIHIRKPLKRMSKKDVDAIIDKAIRKKVENQLTKLKIDDPQKAFADPGNLPKTKIGKEIVYIRSATIRKNYSGGFNIGGNDHARYVMSDSNHHIEIVEVTVPKNKITKWEGHVVSMFDAYQRKKKGEPIIKRDFGKNKKFVFSLAGSDIIELDNNSNGRDLYMVRTIPRSKQLYYTPINDARPKKIIGTAGLTSTPDGLRVKKCKKIVVTPLCLIRNANN